MEGSTVGAQLLKKEVISIAMGQTLKPDLLGMVMTMVMEAPIATATVLVTMMMTLMETRRDQQCKTKMRMTMV